ncbi:hypothetical protein [Oricola sp.]|uniref:hypothetical protein n=1 Tax=Oricola sp. TaxID=1979950 RepID=UPI0025CCDDC3|nr:hypothetical protein [Oricola sp.]MCI5076334.1 hypothetical protein [Oricola sp.]
MPITDTNDDAAPASQDLTITLDSKLKDGLHSYVAAEPTIRTPSDAVTQILREWLRERGYFHPGVEGTRPEDLTSANDG